MFSGRLIFIFEDFLKNVCSHWGNLVFALAGCRVVARTRQISLLHNMFVYRIYTECGSQVFLNDAAVTYSSSQGSRRRVLDISCLWLCGFTCPCSGVCCSDTVIMFSNRGTFQALCWLLIGLQCNDCVILMTQIQLIVIFMCWEDRLSSVGRDGAEVCECVWGCVGVGNKGRWLCASPLQFILLCFWKAAAVHVALL